MDEGGGARAARSALGVRPVYKRIDTCAAEFASPTAYMYSTYEAPFAGAAELRGATLRRARRSSFSAAARTASARASSSTIAAATPVSRCSEAGYETIMINCNPETVSTDYDTSDRLYFEPLTAEDVLAILDKEQRERDAQGRHRPVRRPDAAEARPCASSSRARRSSAPRSIRSTSPRTATGSSGCSTSSA